MKKIFILVCITIISFNAKSYYNFDFSAICNTGQTLYYKIYGNNTVGVTYPQYSNLYNYYDGFSEPTGHVIIPDSVLYNSVWYKVTKITNYAFRACSSLTSITIPNSVTSIEGDAFEGCTGLTSVTIPNSVTSIEGYAFYNCTSLTSITLPNSVTSIGACAFKNCTGLTSVTIGNSVTSIGFYAFEGCNNITTLNYNAKNCTTYNNAFIDKASLTTLTIGDSVQNIPNNFVNGCTGLTSVTIGNSVTSIGYYAFEGCNNITTLNYNAKNCTTYNNAFKNKTSLTTLTIGDSVQNIPNSFVNGCTGLTSVTIPNSVTSIGSGAFEGCNNITTLNYNAKNCTTYNNAFIDKASLTTLTIGDSVQNIPNNFVSGCTSLTSITIPNSVASIGESAFYNCTGLTSITLPDSITHIENSTFKNCTGLTSITLPNSVTSIGEYAFYKCTNLTSVTIGNSVISIGGSAFRKCTSLTSITIPNSVTSIGEWAFSHCTSLTSVIIPDSVTSLEEYTFYNCTGLTSVIIPDSVTSLEEYTFYNCTGLTSVTIPNSVTSIGNFAFYNCDNIQNINTNARYIGNSAFAYCDRLVNVILGDSVKKISSNAFRDCFRLANLTMGKSVDTIGANAFNGCIRLNNVILSDSLRYIDSNAFQRCKAFEGKYTIPSKVEYIGDYAFDSCSLISSIVMKGNPPTIFANTFNTISNSTPIFVPCGKVIDYYVTNYWENFTDIRESAPFEVEAFSSDASLGEVVITKAPTCADSLTRLQANASYGYHFTQWNDGNTSNPRSFVAVQDTSFTAFFAQNKEYITVESNDNTMGTVSGSGEYNYMVNIVISATANNGYHFLRWNDGNTQNPRIVVGDRDSTFTAIFVSNVSNITVSNNNENMGNVSGGGVYYYQNQAIISAIANYGYHFTRWNDGNTDNPRTIIVDRDSSFTANFDFNIYAIAINTNNTTMGYTSGTGNYNYLSQIGISATANYGYHFTQWSDGNTDNPRTIFVDRDSVFVAQFVPNTYTITTEANDPTMGSAYGGGAYSYNTQNIISATSNYGYHFVSWSDGNTDNPRIITISNNANYTAQFEINTYNIITNTSNPAIGTASGGGTYNYNTPVNITATANYGYHFTQWSDGNTDNPRLITVIQNATYTAQFAINSYSVSVESNNQTKGNVLGSGSYVYNTPATITASSNYGYHFTQWNDGNTENPRTIIVTQDISFIAQFDNNNYTITTNSNNNALGNVLGAGSYEYNSIISLTAQPNNHYHFLRWNDYITDNPRTINVLQDSVFTAFFEIDTHRVSLSSANEVMGAVEGAGYFDYGTLKTINAIANYGYHFTHWSDGNIQNPRTIYLVNDTNLVAYFMENDYNVALYSNDTNRGTVAGMGVYSYQSQAILTATEKYGYHFSQWSDGNTDNPRNMFITRDTSLQAIFDYNVYSLALSVNDETMGEVAGTGEYNYLSTITISATPNEHYHFVSWNDGSTQNPRQITVEQDTSFVALFEIDTHFVATGVNNESYGQVTDGSVYDYGTPITLTANATTGYHFTQWNDGNTENPRNIIVTQDTSFVAWFEIDTFFVDVSANDVSFGSTSGSGVYDWSSEVVISATPNEHYHFVQWQDGNTSNPRLVTITKDTSFVAIFQEDTRYTLQVVSNNQTMGTVEGAGEYYEGETISIKATANEHYHFSQWSDGNTDNPRLVTVISDNTFIANFAKDIYTVSVESENVTMGTVYGAGEYEYQDVVEIYAVAYAGYKFLQWNDENTDNPRQINVLQNATYIANFIIDDGVGLEAKEKDEFVVTLYPNPTTSNATLLVKGLTEEATIMVTDQAGRVISTTTLALGQETMEVETSKLASGVYYIRIQTANSVRTEKLIKNN